MFRPLLAAAALFSSPSLAHDFQAGSLFIAHPHSYEAPLSAPGATGFFSVTNGGAAPDRLIAIRPATGSAGLYRATQYQGQITRNRVANVEIAPGETVTFGPAGYQVLFSGLSGQPWTARDAVPAVLVFETAGEVPVVFHIETLREGDGDGHFAH